MADSETITLGNRRIELSHLDKLLFPESGLTKRDLVDYYRRIADTALPYFRDRPLSMHRFPDGIEAEGFFQKNVPDHFPDWFDREEMKKEGGKVTYAIVNDAAALVYIANQGCITPHLSLARRDKPDHPDRLIFDLDPSDDDFAKVQETARLFKELLDRLELPVFIQTTGSRGFHLVVPLDRSEPFDQVRDFAHRLAERMAAKHRKLMTVEHRKGQRGDRVFLDTLRNAYGQTAVAPYAVRAKAGAPVATPLRWRDAAASDLTPQKYTIGNIFRRLAQTADPWAGIDGKAVALGAARQRLAEIS